MGSTDPFEHQLRELAKSMREKLLSESEVADRRCCSLCGIEELKVDTLPTAATVEFYSAPCGETGCSGSINLMKFVAQTPQSILEPLEKVEGFRCTDPGCKAPNLSPADAIDGYDPYNTKDYHLPTTLLVNSPIEEHHISYRDDDTVMVCSRCHSRIHADNDIYNDLVPELSRKEAREMGEIKGGAE